MADSRDILGKNRKFKGTTGIKLPEGTEAQRVDEVAQIRFNTESNLAEYYDGTIWKSIDSPPTVDSVSPSTPVDDGSTVTEITITGKNFQSGLTLDILGSDGTVYTVSSFTLVSSTSLTFDYTSALAAAGVNTPYNIRVSNPTGLSGTFIGFTPNTGPIFNTASGSLGSISLGANGSTFTQISVTDTSGGVLVYSIINGALPDGVSINSGTGALSGVTTVTGTFGFTVQVTDGTTTRTRDFNATVLNPFVVATGGTITTSGDFKIHTFTGPGTFTVTSAGVPSTPNVIDYLVVGGGGGGRAANAAGGGGAGGFRLSNATGMPGPNTSPLANPVGLTLPATSYPVTVGGGGSGAGSGASGANSVFSTITSAGGGTPNGNNTAGLAGGSGGAGVGGGPPGTSNPSAGGAGNTPPTSPPQGNTGGRGYDGQVTNTQGGGGGGAGAVGGNAGQGSGAPGGVGSYVLATGFAGANGTTGPVPAVRYFSGGGGGGTDTPSGSTFPGGSGGGGQGGNGGSAGSTNTGGGGGGGPNANAGGSGIVIIRYKYQ